MRMATQTDMMNDMKTISLGVSESDYEAFRAESKRTGRSIASLIREAMQDYRAARMESGFVLREVPVFHGTGRQAMPLPKRWEVMDEMTERVQIPIRDE